MISIQRGVVRDGHDDAVEAGPDLLDAASWQRAQPRDPARDAQPFGQPLQLLLRRARADDGDVPAAHQFHAGAEEQVESLLGNEPADETDGQADVGRPLRVEREWDADLWRGAVGQGRMITDTESDGRFVDPDDSEGTRQSPLAAELGDHAVAEEAGSPAPARHTAGATAWPRGRG